MAASPLHLVELAGAIADLTPVDWEALERDANSPVERAAVRRLRLLERLVRACAEVVPPGTAWPGEGSQNLDDVLKGWGPFTIQERIGRGAFGDVYRAHDRRLDRVVALKLLRPGRERDDAGSDVIHEGQLLAKVRHPNVVTVHGAERIDGRVGVWMEFVDGRTLEQELRANGPLSAAEVIEVGTVLCSALLAVHEAGLLHRDVKTHNVMRARDGRILLTDFGAGRTRAGVASPANAGELAGTPLFLAPEVLGGQAASIASEIYSLGVVLYHLATNSYPVRGRTVAELQAAHERGERGGLDAYRDRVPRKLAAAIDRAIAVRPESRFTSLSDLESALNGARSTRPRAVLGATALALATLGVIGLDLWPSSSSPRITRTETLVENETGTLGIVAGDRIFVRRTDGLFAFWRSTPDVAEQIGRPSDEFEVIDANSADSSYLALKRTDDGRPALWIIEARTHFPRPVREVRCESASWDPRGRRIACLSVGRLDVVFPNGDVAMSVRLPEGAVGTPRWSPNGGVIRFALRHEQGEIIERQLWECDVVKGQVQPLLPGWQVRPYQPDGEWTSDGEAYVFLAGDMEHVEVWARRETRGFLARSQAEPVQLTHGTDNFGPTIRRLPDGAFVVNDSVRRDELVRFDEEMRRFLPELGAVSAMTATWSHDRRSVVYLTTDKRIVIADADGGHARPFVGSSSEAVTPAWSPDDQWIAFVGRLTGERMEIFRARPDDPRRPIRIGGSGRDQGDPSWSWDGREICYGDVPKAFGVPDGGEVLHIFNLDTDTTSQVPGSEGLWSCRYSPDGRQIAATMIDRHMNLKVLNLKTMQWRTLRNADHVNEFIWSKDSESIYYVTSGDEKWLRRVNVANDTVEDLADLSLLPRGPNWVGLTRDGAPLVVRAAGTHRLVALHLEGR